MDNHSKRTLKGKKILMNSKKAEILSKWYLRLNGYFIVDNFVVHNPLLISKGIISNSTETDILAIRHRHSREIAGALHIANDTELLDSTDSAIDFVIAEVKTGNEDRPNKVWRDNNQEAIAYIIRFAGFIEAEEQIQIANYLQQRTASIDKLIKNIEAQIEKLQELRKIKIYEAVTGKIKVNAYAEATA